MKKFFFGLVLMSSFAAFAGDLFYSNGPAKGKSVSRNTSYVGISDICFTGGTASASKKLYAIIFDDIEKASVFTKLSGSRESIIYGFVDTKCTDEGASDVVCRTVKTAKRCL